MRNRRNENMVCRALAALAFNVALAHSNATAAANISTAVASIHSTRPIDDAAAGGPTSVRPLVSEVSNPLLLNA